MQFDPGNKIVGLCVEGMTNEMEGRPGEAAMLFSRAWNEAENDFEKFIAAHYLARHQDSVAGKLKWDETALACALKTGDENLKASYPSLYLNIAKCYEDLGDTRKAIENYEAALSFSAHLPGDGYGNLIRSGIINGINRVK